MALKGMHRILALNAAIAKSANYFISGLRRIDLNYKADVDVLLERITFKRANECIIGIGVQCSHGLLPNDVHIVEFSTVTYEQFAHTFVIDINTQFY